MNWRRPALWINTDMFAPRLLGDERSPQARGHGTLTAPSLGRVPRHGQVKKKKKGKESARIQPRPKLGKVGLRE